MNNFDFEKEMNNGTRQLITVYDDKYEDVANFFEMQLSKRGKYTTVLWKKKHYESNKVSMSSKEKVLFIGLDKDLKKRIADFGTRFSKFEMKYGWTGNKGIICVEEFLDKNYFNEFKKYYETLADKNDYEDNELKKNFVYDATVKIKKNEIVNKIDSKLPKFVKKIGKVAVCFTPGAAGTAALALLANDYAYNKKIEKYQYKAAIMEFAQNGIDVFMGDNN